MNHSTAFLRTGEGLLLRPGKKSPGGYRYMPPTLNIPLLHDKLSRLSRAHNCIATQRQRPYFAHHLHAYSPRPTHTICPRIAQMLECGRCCARCVAANGGQA
jgi:hypothetical protein